MSMNYTIVVRITARSSYCCLDYFFNKSVQKNNRQKTKSIFIEWEMPCQNLGYGFLHGDPWRHWTFWGGIAKCRCKMSLITRPLKSWRELDWVDNMLSSMFCEKRKQHDHQKRDELNWKILLIDAMYLKHETRENSIHQSQQRLIHPTKAKLP
jgi:hypothetical protein